ncbi:major facilitator superfamily domain-containing protein [Hysterangium stoloniferum]|nr:major facilitator superfamily domain-containing protein [Hysterangium stoloniferum]
MSNFLAHPHAKAPVRDKLAQIYDDSVEHLSTALSIQEKDLSLSSRSIDKGVVIASCLAYFSNQYSISAVAVHLYAVNDALHNLSDFLWFINGTSLVVMIVGPVVAYYANFKTRKWIILGGLIFGVVGQLVSGLARGVHFLIIGQALVGASLATQPLMVTIPAEVLAQNKRRLAQLATNMAGGLGGLSGAILGGVMLKPHTTSDVPFAWPWLFRVGAALYGATLVLFAVTYQPLQPRVSVSQIKPKFDWMGWCLLGLGIVPLVTGLTIAGEPSSWGGLDVIIPLTVGCSSTVLFVIWEICGTTTGLFNHDMFKHGRNFPITLALFFLEGVLFVVFLVWYNQQVYELFVDDPLLQGLRFAVFYGAITLLAPLVAVYCAKTKSIKSALVVGYVVIVAAVILMATSTLQSGKLVIFYAALAGIGLTAPLVTLMTSIQLATPVDLIHAVIPLATLMRTLGIVVANVLSDIVINTVFDMSLRERLSNALLPLGLTPQNIDELFWAFRARSEELVDIIGEKEGFSAKVIQLAHEVSKDAQLAAFQFVWIAVAVLGGLAVIGSLAMSPVANPMPERTAPITVLQAAPEEPSPPYSLGPSPRTSGHLTIIQGNEKHQVDSGSEY